MSRKTSTAALDSFRQASLQKTCRVPRHRAGARTNRTHRPNCWIDEISDRHSERSEESLFHSTGKKREIPHFADSVGNDTFAVSSGNANRRQTFQQAQIAIYSEEVMNSHNRKPAASIRTIVPVILRIILSLILWTLGAASMNLAPAQAGEHHAGNDPGTETRRDRRTQHTGRRPPFSSSTKQQQENSNSL